MVINLSRIINVFIIVLFFGANISSSFNVNVTSNENTDDSDFNKIISPEIQSLNDTKDINYKSLDKPLIHKIQEYNKCQISINDR
ncbi:MAG: hypothetical protein KAU84_04740, partial [Thermoplasmatales archaeon]|nr:hypothetical protein [Thermoplasmatales archaeon]